MMRRVTDPLLLFLLFWSIALYAGQREFYSGYASSSYSFA